MNIQEDSPLSKLFQVQDWEKIQQSVQELSTENRIQLAKDCYQLTHQIYSPLLENSVSDTFEKIHGSISGLFFGRIWNASKNLLDHPEKWDHHLNVLRKIPFFEELTNFDLLALAEKLEELEFDEGDTFIEQYKDVQGVFILEVPAKITISRSKLPPMVRSGMFGEEDCATQETFASSSVTATQDCTAYFIDKDTFNQLIGRVPGLQQKVLQSNIDIIKEERIVAKRESERTEEQRKITKEILDNIGQGSLSINSAGEIGENYSIIAAQYLDRDELAGLPFADLIFRKGGFSAKFENKKEAEKERRKYLREYYRALNMLFQSNQYDPSMILGMLPEEVHVGERFLRLHYYFVQDNLGNVKSVFIRMKDITIEKHLEEKEATEKRILDKMRQNIGGFLSMLDDVEKSFEMITAFDEEFLTENNLASVDHLDSMMRTLHGSKGLTGQFEFNKLRTCIHQLEEWIRILKEHEDTEDHVNEFYPIYMDFEQNYQYALSFRENLGAEIVQVLKGISFSQEEFQEVLDLVTQEEWSKVKIILLQKINVPAKKIINNWEKDIQKLATGFEKQINFKQEIDSDIFIPEKLATKMNIVLGHLYRNCVDHGIESPEKRRSLGKNPIGLIKVRIQQKNNQLQIAIKDNGAGLNEEKIIQLARKNKNLNQTKIDQYIQDQQIWKILFLPSFSSVEKVTEISGRGVGMDAVNKAVQEANGKIIMISKPNKGSAFILHLPLG
ncbi:MAG: signal transduction histidine kinase [bacterium]|jgi:signal transduction histidine kinase